MTNRAILGEFPNGEFGLRISRPGNNVENMSLQQKNIAFDSRWIGSSKILTRGTSTGGTVMYGETLPYIPRVLLLGRMGSNTGNAWEVALQFSEFVEVEDGASWVDNIGFPYAQIYNNRIVLLTYPGAGMTPYNLYSYIVLRD